ncbi:acetyltransferase (GNAT) family protein [Kribbella antiqua]|uniref:Acetyltransferase (GNAT) family protein n=1 Tax=Kribbella antiqua TaxID=2512217 RepID=A0A4R2IQC1_9ACTN|nr:acetyltransferase (GNAT) family protein [Kribbella antiqua]
MNQTQILAVRSAGEPDAEQLAGMLIGLTDLSLYFRFQTAIGRPPRPSLLLRMLCPTGAAWVATRGDAIVGHAMWAWTGADTAELAVLISEAEQRRGLGVRMLSIAAADAVAAGALNFLFVVSPANDLTIRMIRRRWPAAAVERDGTLLNFVVPAVLPDQAEEAADVVDEEIRGLERGEVPTAGELRPMDDVVPAV